MTKPALSHTVLLDTIIGGGQALGTLDDGRKALVWGGLPGETVAFRVTKKKSHFVEGVVSEIKTSSTERISPADPDSYLSTSPWQFMKFSAEQHYKAALIEEAFELHDIVLPNPIEMYSDGHIDHYRNKVEFSWYSDADKNGGETLDLAFFRRGSKGKITIEACSLLPDSMMKLAKEIRDLLHAKKVTARQLKTLLIRCDKSGQCVWQLYLKEVNPDLITTKEASNLTAQGGELIYSDPKSPASRITKRLAQYGEIALSDILLGVPFNYAAESFFQIHLPVYEQVLHDLKRWVVADTQTIDLYSGVGTIGLTIGGDECTLIEIDENAVREMKRNIKRLESNAKAVLAPSEKSLDYIKPHTTVIVDPPRAGLHRDVIGRLLSSRPQRIIYLSCNPTTQARDVALLAAAYGIAHHQGYNFFPRTPHIEHLIVLDLQHASL